MTFPSEFLLYSGKIASVNRRYMKQHILSPEYRESLQSMSMLFASQWHEDPINENCSVLIILTISKQRDIDNCLKPIFDALQHAGVIEDDKLISELMLMRSDKIRREQDAVSIAFFEAEYFAKKLTGE